MTLHEPGPELIDCRHLLWSLGRTVLQQMPLAVLGPSCVGRLRAMRDHPPLSMPVAVRQPEADVHLPATSSVGNNSHAHRWFSCCSDGAPCWSSHDTRSWVRMRTRRPIRLTPGS